MKQILTLTILLLAVGFAAEVVTFDNNWADNPLFSIVSETPMGVEVIFSTQKMFIEEIMIDGVPMKTIGVPGVFLPNNEGAPNLAGTGRYIAIPQGAWAKVTILSSRTEVYHNIDIAPASNIPLDSDDSPLRYEKDMKIYARNAYYPDAPVKLSKPMKIRGVDVVLLGITPFQYNPVTKDLIVYKDIRMRVDFVSGNGHFGEDRLRSRFWEPILQGHLLNYKSLPTIDFYSPERIYTDGEGYGYEYIIIVPDDPVFEAWADTIKVWRKLQGISCEVFTLADIGGSSAADIEYFLNNAYNNWDPAPVAFLLLSDYPSSGKDYGITSPIWNNWCVSDNSYADVDSDNLPDMHHGRICAQTESQLQTMINKFLSYERNPYTSSDFYDKPLVAVAWQTQRWFQLCGEVVRGFFINGLGKDPARQYAICGGTPTPGCAWSTATNTSTVVDYWYNVGWLASQTNPYDETWWNNGSATGITNAINSGAFLVQHRDHGATWAWGEPRYTISDLDNLTNTKFPFVYSTNCLTGKYNFSSETFTEKFHRITCGALGVNAASDISYSFVNDTYVWGTYDGLWPEFDPGYPGFDMTGGDNLRPCQAMTSGKYYLEASSWPYNTNHKFYTYHLFHHHGDVFNTLYSEIPQSLTVSHAATLIAGAISFTVTANNNSVIALTVNEEIIGLAQGTGLPIDITIPPQPPGNTILVTVTKANYYRYEANVQVVATSYPYVFLSTDIIDDASGGNGDGIVDPGETIDYGVWAKNLGIGTAQNIYGLLSESDQYVNITVDSSWYGDIPEHDSSLSNPYYTFSVANDCPNRHKIEFTLEFHDIDDSIFYSYRSFTVYAPILIFCDVSVVDGNDGVLYPGETADLVVTIRNKGSAATENVTSTLIEDSPYITINDASGNFGSIDPGNTADNSSDPYNITASPTTPQFTIVQFQIEVVSGVYVDTLEFSLVVGPKHYYLWNPVSRTSGQNMHTILGDLGYNGDYGTTLAPNLNFYQALLVVCGVRPDSYFFSIESPEAAAIVDYLQTNKGRVYMEGANVWYMDPWLYNAYNFCSVFGISVRDFTYGEIGPIAGISGTFTNGMNFSYSGEKTYADDIDYATGTGFLIFRDSDSYFYVGVANNAGIYRTVGISFELGLLDDGTPPSTRAALLDSIMTFFGTIIIGIEEETGLADLPIETALTALYPNPGVQAINIKYQVAHTSRGSLQLYDVAGRLVRTIKNNEICLPGYYTVLWDAKDDLGRKVSAGVYFVQLVIDPVGKTEDYKGVQKIVLLQ